MLFILLAILIFMGAFLHTAYVDIEQKSYQLSQTRQAYSQVIQKNQFMRHDLIHKQILIDRYESERMLTVTVSAYTNRKKETDDTPNITATMDRVRPEYTVAVSHDLIHLLGHRIYIYGLGVFVVQDLMDDRWSMRVDVYFDKSRLARAKAFGLKKNRKLVVLNKEYFYKYNKEKGEIINEFSTSS